MADEFNKYLSYVRNLGFEDTPDYDYLRELFTQALKNTGEVEDGEYDWMKLNNGKGWEAMKQHPSQHLHAANALPNPSNRALVGGTDTPTGRGPGTPAIPPGRLNAPQPLAPSPQKPGAGKTRPPGVSGAAPIKRQSGVAGGLTDMGTPAASTQAQFTQSNANLPHRMSHLNPNSSQPTDAQQPPRQQNAEPERSTFQKIMKVMCCGKRLFLCSCLHSAYLLHQVGANMLTVRRVIGRKRGYEDSTHSSLVDRRGRDKITSSPFDTRSL